MRPMIAHVPTYRFASIRWVGDVAGSIVEAPRAFCKERERGHGIVRPIPAGETADVPLSDAGTDPDPRCPPDRRPWPRHVYEQRGHPGRVISISSRTVPMTLPPTRDQRPP